MCLDVHTANSPAPQPWLRPSSEENLRRIPLASPAGTSCGRETGPYPISRGELESNVAAGIAFAAEGIESLLSLHPANSSTPQPWLRPRSEESLRRIPPAYPAGTSCGRETGGNPLNLLGSVGPSWESYRNRNVRKALK